MHKPKQGRRSSSRTPSPARKGSKGKNRLSPWTAQRARKKGKSCSPDTKPLGWQEPPSGLAFDGLSTDAENANHLAHHLACNPFREHLALDSALRFSPAVCRTQSRIPVLQPTQEQPLPSLPGHELPIQPTPWTFHEAVSDAELPISSGPAAMLQGCGPSSTSSSTSTLTIAGSWGPTSVDILQPSFNLDSLPGRTSEPVLGPKSRLRPASGKKASRFGQLASKGVAKSHAKVGTTEKAVAEEVRTPSPEVAAPGIRPDWQACSPPRVPTSCKTKRLVLGETPQKSQPAAFGLAGGAVRQPVRTALCFDSPDEDEAMAVDGPLQDSSFLPGPRIGSSNPIAQTSAIEMHGSTLQSSQCFSGWAGQTGQACSKGKWPPVAVPAPSLQVPRDAANSTTVGHAWEKVKSGEMQLDDIDSLNALLKSYCKVRSEPDEAEELVDMACKDGRLRPNYSTYHHITALWIRHAQLNNRIPPESQ